MADFHGTTILSVRREGKVAMGGDGQVTMNDTVVKSKAAKVRLMRDGAILAGFAGGVADALALFEKFESQLERHPRNLTRAAADPARRVHAPRVLLEDVDDGPLASHQDLSPVRGGSAMTVVCSTRWPGSWSRE